MTDAVTQIFTIFGIRTSEIKAKISSTRAPKTYAYSGVTEKHHEFYILAIGRWSA
jgi:hypothetical protein